ncbi:MAG: cell division protein ZapB [Chlorobi bacterium]|nr:cell division protein ZapB [Chlorobiota bacterium]
MNNPNLDIIVELQNKIDTLVDRYNSLKEDVKSLNEKNKRLVSELNEANENNRELEEKYNNLKLSGNIIAETGDPGEAKKRINQIVREIDKCIALLNR